MNRGVRNAEFTELMVEFKAKGQEETTDDETTGQEVRRLTVS
jgi:hypothetical protein